MFLRLLDQSRKGVIVKFLQTSRQQLFFNPEVYFNDWLGDQVKRWTKPIFWSKSPKIAINLSLAKRWSQKVGWPLKMTARSDLIWTVPEFDYGKSIYINDVFLLYYWGSYNAWYYLPKDTKQFVLILINHYVETLLI